MWSLFLSFLLFALFAAGLFFLIVGPEFTGDNDAKYSSRPASLVFFILALVLAGLTCLTMVDQKNEGVILTFGKVSEQNEQPGIGLKWPWQSMVEIDGKAKMDYFNGSDTEDDDSTHYHGPIKVRLGDNGVAEVYGSLRWSRADGEANVVYGEYRDDDPVNNMRDNLVVPLFRDAVNAVFGQYRPTAPIDNLNIDFEDPKAITEALNNMDLAPDTDMLADKVKDVLNERLTENGDSLVRVDQVIISYLSLPEATQTKINAFLAEVANTRNALQKQATNTALAKANEILSDSLSKDPNVLVSRCYDLLEDGKFVLPAGGSCWPGGESAVVIPSTK